MKQYLRLLETVLYDGTDKKDRTGTGTRSIFGHQMRFDLEDGFPLLTTKKLHLKSIIHELLWMLNGDTNVKYLQDHGVSIWDEWANPDGDLGPVYGAQWRSWPGETTFIPRGKTFDPSGTVHLRDTAYGEYRQQQIDQIAKLLDGLQNNPDSRRHIVTAWNPTELDSMALPPCHLLFQCYVASERLSLQVYQRSADVFLGVPFNIASYALLTMMLAREAHLLPGELIWTGGDCHLYLNHLEQAKEQLGREPRDLPHMHLSGGPGITNYRFEDFELVGYNPHPHIPAKVSV